MNCETRARNDRGLVAQFLAKGGGRILRLALVYELMTWTQRREGSPPSAEIEHDLSPPPAEVGLDAVERAIRYFYYAEAMLRRTLISLEPTRASDDARDISRRIAEKKWRHFTARDIGREPGFRWFRGESQEARQRGANAVKALIDANIMRPDIVSVGRGFVNKWEVHPHLKEAIRD